MKNSNAKRAAELVGKAHSALSSLYSKGKEKTKKAIHDKKKSIAREVIDETKRKVDKSDRVILRNAESIVREAYKGGGGVGKYKIIKDEKGVIEQGFYGVFDTSKNPYEIIDIFEFKTEAEEYLKEIKEKGVDNVDSDEFNGQIHKYKRGGKLIGNQYKLDVNKNGKIDAEDLAIIRGEKKMETGGGVGSDRMYGFLADDLKELEVAINEKDSERVQRFFSYWNAHLKSLKTSTNSRMYGFLADDLKELEVAISENDSERVQKFFSYWNAHLKSLKMADGGGIDKVPGETYSASSDGHSGFYGIDADLQTSLEEYGFVAKSMGTGEYAVVYKIDENFYDLGYITESDLDNILLGTEWADKEDIESFLSYVGDETSIDYYVRVNDFRNKLNDMFNYFGYENIMGSSYMPWDKETAYAEIGIDYAERGKNVKGSKHVHLTKGWRNPHGYKAVKGSDKNRDYSKGHPHIKVDKGFAMPHGYEAVDGVYAKHYDTGGSVSLQVGDMVKIMPNYSSHYTNEKGEIVKIMPDNKTYEVKIRHKSGNEYVKFEKSELVFIGNEPRHKFDTGGGVGTKYEINLAWKGLKDDTYIGDYIVSSKTLDRLEEEWRHILSIAVLDESNKKPISYLELEKEIYSKGRDRGFKADGDKFAGGGWVESEYRGGKKAYSKKEEKDGVKYRHSIYPKKVKGEEKFYGSTEITYGRNSSGLIDYKTEWSPYFDSVESVKNYIAEKYKTKFDTGGGVGLHKHVTITKRGHRLPHGYKAVRGATKKADYSHKGVEMDLGWRLSHGYVLEKGADKKAYYKHGGGISECTTEEKMFVKALIERYMDNLSEDGKEVATSVLHKLK